MLPLNNALGLATFIASSARLRTVFASSLASSSLSDTRRRAVFMSDLRSDIMIGPM